jgi:hypothetical protein
MMGSSARLSLLRLVLTVASSRPKYRSHGQDVAQYAVPRRPFLIMLLIDNCFAQVIVLGTVFLI